ncbi:MAG: response regulator [Hyphomonadaceae bacterium]|nr:response regulator [Hyphomonadaceae bacterium]
MTDCPDDPAAEKTFLATASHEIRTPLNGILGTVSLLLETELAPAQREYAEAIRASGARLLDLLNTVLDHARLDAGGMELEDEIFCPVRLGREVVELLSPRAHAGGIDIASRALELPMATRRGDGGRIRQILFNLIGNALKFTESGCVMLDMEEVDGGIVYRIIDTGPGIAPADRERLFEAFRQSQPRDARKDGGVGLGLSIVRRLTGLLGGQISVSGDLGLGTQFEVCLPLEKADRKPTHDLPQLGGHVGLIGMPQATTLALSSILQSAAITPVLLPDTAPTGGHGCDVLLIGADLPARRIVSHAAQTHALVVLRPEDRGAIGRFRDMGCKGWLVRPLRASSVIERIYLAREGAPEAECDTPTGQGAHVLIADDNPVNALIARRALESTGFTVTVAATGVEALESFDTRQVDLVLMDLRMPVMDGFEATRRLRAGGQTVPVIAVSAEVNPDIEREARRAGADLVAAKPIDPETLRNLAVKWAVNAGRKAGAA